MEQSQGYWKSGPWAGCALKGPIIQLTHQCCPLVLNWMHALLWHVLDQSYTLHGQCGTNLACVEGSTWGWSWTHAVGCAQSQSWAHAHKDSSITPSLQNLMILTPQE